MWQIGSMIQIRRPRACHAQEGCASDLHRDHPGRGVAGRSVLSGGRNPPGREWNRRQLLRHAPFRIYWLASLVSSSGTWLHNVTASVVMLGLTGSPMLVGVVNAATFLPLLVFSLPAGALSDRVDRRLVVVTTQALALSAAATLTIVTALQALTPGLLVASCFAIGTASAFAKPALSAMLPALVPRQMLPTATALTTLQFNLAQVIGPAASSVLLFGSSPAWAFGTNAATFLAPILAMRWMPAGPTRQHRGTGDAAASRRSQAVRQGLRYVASTNPMPLVLLCVALSNAAVEAFRTLAPAIATQALGLDAAVAGVLIMGRSGGVLLGLTVFDAALRHLGPRRLLLSAFLLQVAGCAGVSLSDHLSLTVAAGAVMGLGFSFAIPLLSARLQDLADDEFRARVMSIYSMAHLGVRPFYSLLAGGTAALLNVHTAIALAGATALGGWVVVARRWSRR
jgi:MFS family permease